MTPEREAEIVRQFSGANASPIVNELLAELRLLRFHPTTRVLTATEWNDLLEAHDAELEANAQDWQRAAMERASERDAAIAALDRREADEREVLTALDEARASLADCEGPAPAQREESMRWQVRAEKAERERDTYEIQRNNVTDDLAAERGESDAWQERAEHYESQLAALREAAEALCAAVDSHVTDPNVDDRAEWALGPALDRASAAIADTDAIAAEHNARVRREALEEALSMAYESEPKSIALLRTLAAK